MENHQGHNDSSHLPLAISATTHCLIGCGLGEVFGVIIGTMLGLSFVLSLAIGVIAGFVFGYLLGMVPLIRAGIAVYESTKIVFTTETLSIIVMETAEVLTEIYFPGMMQSGLSDAVFWMGLATALVVGFAAAFPVNLYMVKKGLRHKH